MKLPPPHPTWSRLLFAVRSGDKRAREQLADALCTAAYRYFRRRLSERMDAEDLTQEIVMRVFSNLARVRSGKRFCAWTYAIMRQVFVDFLRLRRNGLPPAPPPDQRAEVAQPAAGSNGTLSPSERAALERSLGKLLPVERDLLESRSGMDETPFSIVAESWGISNTLARVKYLRAKVKLAALLRTEAGMATWFERHGGT